MMTPELELPRSTRWMVVAELFLKLGSPLYIAVIPCAPTDLVAVADAAFELWPAAVRCHKTFESGGRRRDDAASHALRQQCRTARTRLVRHGNGAERNRGAWCVCPYRDTHGVRLAHDGRGRDMTC